MHRVPIAGETVDCSHPPSLSDTWHLPIRCNRSAASEHRSAMELRTIKTGDGPLLRELTLRSVEDAPYAFGGPGTLDEERQSPDAKWDDLAAECGGDVDEWRDRCVGYLVLDGETACAKALGYLSLKTPGLALMSGVWVDPRYRRQGLGKQMVEATCLWALDKGATQLRLWVDETNPDGGRFYESLGFEATGQRRPSGPGSSVQEVGYERPLAAK